MNEQIQTIESEDLVFMGKVNASISHELKNIMAIISETSGLLSDLVEMAGGGEKIELKTIQDCCKDIDEEIHRGFATIKQMNRFAHSVDQPVETVDLGGLLELIVGLAGFLSFACSVRLDQEAQTGVQIQTSPFRLQNLIYQTLVFAFQSAGTKGMIDLSVHAAESGGAIIAISGFETKTEHEFPSESLQKVAAAIDAEIEVDASAKKIDIVIRPLSEPSD